MSSFINKSQDKNLKPRILHEFNENTHLTPLDKTLQNEKYMLYRFNFEKSKAFQISLFLSCFSTYYFNKLITKYLFAKHINGGSKLVYNIHFFSLIFWLYYQFHEKCYRGSIQNDGKSEYIVDKYEYELYK